MKTFKNEGKMKRLAFILVILLTAVTSVSAQSFLKKVTKVAESVTSVSTNELPSADDINWTPLKIEGSGPKVTSNEYCIMLHSPNAIETKVCGSDGTFYIDGKMKNREACRINGWKVFKKYTHISSTSFKDGKFTCYYLLEQEVNDEGDIVKREVHVIKY